MLVNRPTLSLPASTKTALASLFDSMRKSTSLDASLKTIVQLEAGCDVKLPSAPIITLSIPPHLKSI